MADKVEPGYYDEMVLLRKLCAIANMPYALVRKAVLVVEVGAAPMLYVESFLSQNCGELTDEELRSVVPVEVEAVEITSVQSVSYAEKVPKEKPSASS